MRCPDPDVWLAFYGGETDESTSRRLGSHLRDCSLCQEQFDALSRLGADLRGALAVPPVQAPKRRASFSVRSFHESKAAKAPLAVAAALALAVLGLVLYLGSGPKEHRSALARADRPIPKPAPPEGDREIPLAVSPLRPAAPPPTDRPGNPRLELLPPRESAPPDPGPEPEPERGVRAESAFPTPEPSAPPAPGGVKDGVEKTQTLPSLPVLTLATLERAEGEVEAGSPSGRRRAREGLGIAAGQELRTGGSKSRALVRFPDGTRMELGEKTVLRGVSDRAGASGVGRCVELQEGTLTLDVAHQLPDRAMIVLTPQGEARILGTVLRLLVDGGPKGSTRLEVLEGKVRLTRLGGASVEVPGGHAAILGEGADLAARPLKGMVAEILHQYTFEEGRLPKIFEVGTLERGPERAHNRYSIAGVKTPGATAGAAVKLVDAGRGLFGYSDELVLGFDYWVDPSVQTLDLQVWSRAQQVTFGKTLWTPVREQWTHVAVPLSELLRNEGGRVLHLKPGEWVPTLWIQAGQLGGMIYLDNFELVRLTKRELRR